MENHAGQRYGQHTSHHSKTTQSGFTEIGAFHDGASTAFPYDPGLDMGAAEDTHSFSSGDRIVGRSAMNSSPSSLEDYNASVLFQTTLNRPPTAYTGLVASISQAGNSNGAASEISNSDAARGRPTRKRAASTSNATTVARRQKFDQRCELPDFFWAHDPDRYSSYRDDCSFAYDDYHSFVRNSLKKHKNRGNMWRENITQEQIDVAQKRVVVLGHQSGQEHKERENWRYTRLALFGTPLDHPIPDCGRHVALKSKATEQEKMFMKQQNEHRSPHSAGLSSNRSVTEDLSTTQGQIDIGHDQLQQQVFAEVGVIGDERGRSDNGFNECMIFPNQDETRCPEIGYQHAIDALHQTILWSKNTLSQLKSVTDRAKHTLICLQFLQQCNALLSTHLQNMPSVDMSMSGTSSQRPYINVQITPPVSERHLPYELTNNDLDTRLVGGQPPPQQRRHGYYPSPT